MALSKETLQQALRVASELAELTSHRESYRYEVTRYHGNTGQDMGLAPETVDAAHQVRHAIIEAGIDLAGD